MPIGRELYLKAFNREPSKLKDYTLAYIAALDDEQQSRQTNLASKLDELTKFVEFLDAGQDEINKRREKWIQREL